MTLKEIMDSYATDKDLVEIERKTKQYIVEAYQLNKAQADIIYKYAYEEYHSCMSDVVYAATDLASLIADAIKAI